MKDPFDATNPSKPNNISRAVEFVTPSVTSRSPLEVLGLTTLSSPIESFFSVYEPHLHYINFREHGYMLLRVSRERVKAEYWYTRSLRYRTSDEHLGAWAVTERGSNQITSTQIL